MMGQKWEWLSLGIWSKRIQVNATLYAHQCLREIRHLFCGWFHRCLTDDTRCLGSIQGPGDEQSVLFSTSLHPLIFIPSTPWPRVVQSHDCESQYSLLAPPGTLSLSHCVFHLHFVFCPPQSQLLFLIPLFFILVSDFLPSHNTVSHKAVLLGPFPRCPILPHKCFLPSTTVFLPQS